MPSIPVRSCSKCQVSASSLRESLKRNARAALKPRHQGSEGEDDGEDEEEEAEEEEVQTVPGADVRPTWAGKKKCEV